MVLFSVIVNTYKQLSWKSKLHDDGSMFDGYFIVGITTPSGEATYHYDLKHWDMFDCDEWDKAPKWDGHTPDDVCNRLLSIVK